MKRARSDNLSGFAGVSPYGKRWGARITQGGKQRFLGVFDTPEEAYAARVAAGESDCERRRVWVPLHHTEGLEACHGVAVEVVRSAYRPLAYVPPAATRKPSGEPMIDTAHREWPCAACGRPVIWAHLSLAGGEYV